MLVLWRPAMVSETDFRMVRHCWTKWAALTHNELIECELTPFNLIQQWDRVGIIHGAYILWVRPAFIPSPQLEYEIHIRRNDGKLLLYTPDYSFAAFSLNGQTAAQPLVLPRTPHPFEWLEAHNKGITQLELRPFDEGCYVSPVGTHFEDEAHAKWLERLEAWSKYLEWKSRP